MIKYLQLPFHFDAAKLQAEVQALISQNWKLHYQTKHYDGEWSALPLRSIGGAPDNVVIAPTNELPYADTVFLQGSAYLQEVLNNFKCPLMAVRLLKLSAGAVIKEHRDAELYFEKGEIRIHIPVITNDAVEFYSDKERIKMKEGECWYVNFNLPHSISNKSNVDRIHLVIDAEVNEWVKELFALPSENKKEISDPDFDDAAKLEMIAHLRAMNTETGNKIADEMEGSLNAAKQK